MAIRLAALAGVLAVLASGAALGGALDPPPVLAYTFSDRMPRVVRDHSDFGNHATIFGEVAYESGPSGPAVLFDGASYIRVPHRPELAPRDALTLDLWLRADRMEGRTCILNKGERYRLVLAPGGQIHFGLKSADSRGDLTGGQVELGRWHRVTAVFERPLMVLYIDGQEVGRREWDDRIGGGGDLFLGDHGARPEHFHGALDQVRIFAAPRPPQMGDERIAVEAAGRTRRVLDMERMQDAVAVDTGPMQFVLDMQRGALRSLQSGGKVLVEGNDAPPLFATLFESEAYDGTRDSAPGRFVEAAYSCEGVSATLEGDLFRAESTGALAFPGGDAIRFRLAWEAERGARRIKQTLTLEPQGPFRNRFLREIGLRQPLALAFRKRVVKASDQGLRWDTRHNYQFHMHIRFAEEPDRNWWRHFYVDQETPDAYTVWRAESDSTAGLYPFRGRQAPGWMTAYDQAGGVLFAYRDMPARAPKALYVNADGGAEAQVLLHARTHPAADLRDPRTLANVFGDPHETDWIFFGGEEVFEQPDRELAEAWGVESLSSDPPPDPKPLCDEVQLWTAEPPPADFSLPVAGGIPLPRGAVRHPEQVRLFVRDREAPLQTEILGYWPDQSVKWMLLIFPLDGDGGHRAATGTGEGDEVRFVVTLRDGSSVPCRLVFGPNVRKGAVDTPLNVRVRGGQFAIDTGPLSLVLGTGERFIRRAAVGGRDMLRDDGQPQAFVDFLRMDETYPVGTTHAQGRPDQGPVDIQSVEVLSAGPLRTVVRMEGTVGADAAEETRVILWLEAYAGRPSVRLLHTVEYMHKDPREAFVRRVGLRLPLALDRAALRVAAGGQDGPVPLEAGRAAGLRQFNHLGYEAWTAAQGERFRRVAEHNHRSRGWLSAADGRGGVGAAVRSMWEMFPKELAYRADEGALEIGLWPESAPLMDVRRYSNYPHWAQGESVGGGPPGWVENRYYPNDPFAGTSRTHELLLAFHGPERTPEHLDGLVADFQSQPLVYAGWDWYRDTGITIAQIGGEDPGFGRSGANMQNVADWWLFHQKFQGWYGFWVFGDVGHRFRAGYGRIFPPDALRRILQVPPDQRRDVNIREYPQIQDYFTQNDWAFDNGRWGWGSTEGLVNLFISTQYLRTGNRDLYFFAEACARVSRDVVARHGGRWFGYGTRHGVQHWSDGNHEPRQTVFTEQRFHYFLSGEHRTREWNNRITNESYLRGRTGSHAAHSARTYGILFNWELTGDPSVGETLRNYMHSLCQPEGVAISAPVRFPEGTLYGEPQGLHGTTMFFHTFGAGHALLEYHALTGDERVRDSMIATADVGVRAAQRDRRRGPGNLRKMVAFAANHAPDPATYRQALGEWIRDGGGTRYVFQQVPANREHWTGETAFLEGNVSGGLFWINDMAMVMAGLESEPSPPAAEEEAMQARETRPVVGGRRPPRESWQTEYDHPDFREYIWEPGMPEFGGD